MMSFRRFGDNFSQHFLSKIFNRQDKINLNNELRLQSKESRDFSQEKVNFGVNFKLLLFAIQIFFK